MTDYGNNLSANNPPHIFGGWSQYIYIVPGSFLVRVPDDLPSEVAVLTEVIAVTVGLDRAKQMSAFPSESFRFDDTVVVLGVGPSGHVLPDEGAHAGRRDDHRRGPFRVSVGFRKAAGRRPTINAGEDVASRAPGR